MKEFFTKENITFLLGLIGTIGTAITFINAQIKKRTNFSIKVARFSIGEKGILAYLMFLNNSHSPVTITSVSICINNVYYPAVLTPQEVCHTVHRSKNEIVDTHSEYSIVFPIALSGQFATSGYVYFPLPQGTFVPSTRIFSLKVCTSNGMAVEKLLELNESQ